MKFYVSLFVFLLAGMLSACSNEPSDTVEDGGVNIEVTSMVADTDGEVNVDSFLATCDAYEEFCSEVLDWQESYDELKNEPQTLIGCDSVTLKGDLTLDGSVKAIDISTDCNDKLHQEIYPVLNETFSGDLPRLSVR